MGNQRTTFLKRQREQNRKDKAKAKEERLAARRSSPNGEKGPPIAWDEQYQNTSDDTTDTAAPASPAAAAPTKPNAAPPTKPNAAPPTKPVAQSGERPKAAAPAQPVERAKVTAPTPPAAGATPKR